MAGQRDYAIEEPTSLNTLAILPELIELGVAAIKIEGRQRSPAYVEQVTRVWRAAIDPAARRGAASACSRLDGDAGALCRRAAADAGRLQPRLAMNVDSPVRASP